LTTKKSVFPKNDIHKANGYNPGEFTKMLLTKLRQNSTEEEINALMPWYLKK